MIIGLTGYKGSGKSVVARHLFRHHNFAVLPFAQFLKEMLLALGLTGEHIDGHLKEEPCDLLGGQTPRHAMQTLGTEWGRELIHPDVWVNAWYAIAHDLNNVVADDVRFPNEVDIITEMGGEIWHVQRPGVDIASTHASELHALSLPKHRTILNNKTLDDMTKVIDKWMHSLSETPLSGRSSSISVASSQG